jgi:hypothetical protein
MSEIPNSTPKVDVEVVSKDYKTNSDSSNAKSSNPKEINLENLTRLFEEYFVKKAPSLSDSLKMGIVKYMPIAVIVFLVFTCLIFLPVLVQFLGNFGISFLGYLNIGFVNTFWLIKFLIISVSSAASIYFLFKSYKPLKNVLYEGWELLYYSSLVVLFSSVLQLEIYGMVLTLFWIYIIFQVRSKYKKIAK